MRVVGGDLRGRTLRAVPGRSTRPTADRVRQSVFDRLGQRCDALRVLDLYAGTGALSFEALSRGAAHATLVEKDAKAAQVIERNAEELGCRGRCTLVRDEVSRALAGLVGPFDLVFSDPPYALRAAQETVAALHGHGLIVPGGRLVLERDRREPRPELPGDLELADESRYGDTVVLIARRR